MSNFFVLSLDTGDGEGAWGVEMDEAGRVGPRTRILGRVAALGWLDGSDAPPPNLPLPASTYAPDWRTLLALSLAARAPRLLCDTSYVRRDVECMLRAFGVPPLHPPPAPEPVRGGLILDAKPGVWPYATTVLDVKAMYPSIMIELEADYPQLGAMMRHLKAHRARLPCLKLLMNAVYGLFASRGNAFYHPALANRITARGREILTALAAEVERQGACVLFGVTDSVAFVAPHAIRIDAPAPHIELSTQHWDGCVVFNKTIHWCWRGTDVQFAGPMSAAEREAAWRYLRDGAADGLAEKVRHELDALRDSAAPAYWGACAADASFEERARALREGARAYE